MTYKRKNTFEPGHKKSRGRPPVLIPEVQALIDQEKNVVKVEIIRQLKPKVQAWIQSIIERGTLDGDAIKLKVLLELALGKLVKEGPTADEIELSEDEKDFIRKYRDAKAKFQNQTVVIPASDYQPDDRGEDKDGLRTEIKQV